MTRDGLAIMDLEATLKMNGKRGSWPKLAAFLCFAVACLLLIGSLAAPPIARTLDAPLSQSSNK
jgi:hypothetical protein